VKNGRVAKITLLGNILPVILKGVSDMAKRFLVVASDLPYVKEWLKKAIDRGVLLLLRDDISAARSLERIQTIVDRDLDVNERKKLQVALAVKRSRLKKSTTDRKVTEITEEARDMLLAVAKNRGVTTSDLIVKLLSKEYSKLRDI
jgi:sugar-specific transcriptional regulator TrmB